MDILKMKKTNSKLIKILLLVIPDFRIILLAQDSMIKKVHFSKNKSKEMAGANPKWIEWPKKSLNQICYLDLGYIMLMLTLILYININLHAVLHQNHFDNPVLHKQVTPGPGSYYPENVVSSIKLQHKPEKLQFFGSSSLRFKAAQQTVNNSVGPGYYHLNPKLEIQSAKPKKQVPFQSEQERFEDIGNFKENPGPGSYDPKTQLEDQLIQKMQAGYKAQFGSSEDRFKDCETDNPGPGAYLGKEQKQEFQYVPLVKMPDSNYFFKEGRNPKHNERTSFIPSKMAPPIGVYDLDFYDISKKVQKKAEIDPGLMVRVDGLGFNSSQPRFKNVYNENQEEKEKENELIQQCAPEQAKLEEGQVYKWQVEVPGLGFGNKDSRFKYNNQEKTMPGPGQYYDPHKNLWNRKTYNIEFTGLK